MALFVSLLLVLLGTQFPNTTLALAEVHPVLKWLVAFLDVFTIPMLVIFFYIFPDGRFVPRWTVAPTLLAVGTQALASFVPSLNPFTAPPLLSIPFALGLFGSMLYAQVYRYGRVSNSVQRQQTKWVVFGFAAALVTLLMAILLPMLLTDYNEPGTISSFINTTGLYVAFLLMPVSIGFAILRYRLWDIDFLINRTLVYGVLTAVAVGLYVLVVGGLGTLLQAEENLLLSLLAAGLVAVVFAPLRDRLQRGVNRLMYGERDEPYKVLSRLGEQLESTVAPDAVIPTIVQTIKDALKLPYTALEIKETEGFREVAAAGAPVGDPASMPLTYQGETVGRLILSPRPGETAFSSADRSLLNDLSRQVGTAIHAVRLTTDLQRSRERLVTTREEERRRLRRDLHDGLGPALSSAMLKLGAARRLLPPESAADDLLVEVREDMRATVADVRRLVYDLRPPALDQLGLALAIRDYTQQCSESGLHVVVDAPEQLPPLPAAVEVAVYRIAQEALTNVVRHARAHSCTVRLEHVETPGRSEVQLEITDDGLGLPAERPVGVGTSSMRERAEELGGSCMIESVPGGGTRVLARLPLPPE